jgi:hypothetical protein
MVPTEMLQTNGSAFSQLSIKPDLSNPAITVLPISLYFRMNWLGIF